MSSPSPTPVPTQAPPPPLSRALNLLDGLLARDDVPAAVRRDIAGVFDDLVDIRPPYPPTTPTDRREQPWPVVVQAVVDSLRQLAHHKDPDAPPALTIRHALALRALRRTARHASADSVNMSQGHR